MSKSGYFRRALLKSMDVELPSTFPGGSQTFQWIVLFMYDYPLPMDPFNLSAIRCAAEVLEMYENYCSGNLCEQSDLYLNQVVLQHWADTLIVLQKSQTLQPWCETLLIVSRCIESLAFMACMEVLDPERRGQEPVITFSMVAGRRWNCEAAKEISGKHLWIKDLIAIPFGHFQRIIGSMRRQGMEEKFVSTMIMFYANKWVLSKKTHQFWEITAEKNSQDVVNHKISVILQGVVDLLPIDQMAGNLIPVGFLLSLLSRSLKIHSANDVKKKLQHLIASLLHLAQLDELLFPEKGGRAISSCPEVEAMKKVFVISITSFTNPSTFFTVSKLWDLYLSRLAVDPELSASSFMAFVEIIPISARQNHDHLYRATDTFLLAHPHISEEERVSVSKDLNCQKLSQETCIEAVQNTRMPLRLIVQALFVQQLNTHQAVKDCSESFRFTHSCEFSDTASCLKYQQNSNKLSSDDGHHEAIAAESAGEEDETIADGMPLGLLLKKDPVGHQPNLIKDDFESTSFRLQCLEQEVKILKARLQSQRPSSKDAQRTASFKIFNMGSSSTDKIERPLNHVGGNCIASASWSSQGKYARRILKVFQKIPLFGRVKSKRKQASMGQKTRGKLSECSCMT
ncbi:BTB/POZ domain-containing protein [Nymphaea thermarum]|nr:BTB/POZ domain-containing protein [Nymphaea thermarum]